MKKVFGIIGAGNMGQSIARHLVKAGYQVILSNSRGPASLKAVIKDLGKFAKAGTATDAANADIVLLALPWSKLKTLTGLTDWSNRIVIDATNHFITYAPDFHVADLNGLTSSEVVAGYVPGARLVKAFNTLYFRILASNPKEENGKRVLFISGNENKSKNEISNIIESLGFAVIDLGGLAEGRLQQAKGPLANLNLIRLS